MPATPTPLRPPEWANRCGCAGSRGSCSHDPAAPTPDNGLGGCGECEPHSDATPTPNAAPDVVMSDACSSSVEVSPEAALQGLVGALRARHNPPPGQRAVTTNGWKAVDELELIMRRWRATLDRSKKSEVTAVGKRKADTCKMHFSRLKLDLQCDHFVCPIEGSAGRPCYGVSQTCPDVLRRISTTPRHAACGGHGGFDARQHGPPSVAVSS